MIKAFLFDMDGTLTDSEKYYTEGTFNWVNKIKNVSLKDIYPIIGTNMDETYKILSNISGLSYDEVIKLNTEYFINHPINYNDYIFNDVKDVLNILRNNGYKLALCSMSERWMVEQFIKDCKLENIFDVILSDDEVKNSKPDPEIYLKAIELLNIKSDEAIVIEDSYNGILAGKNANMKVFARNASRYYIDQSRADYIFNDMHEILDNNKLL